MGLTNKKAILFDKDGTLIEYSDLWREAIFAMVVELGKKYKHRAVYNEIEMYQQLGISETYVSDDSPLGTGTSKQIACVLHRYFVSDKAELLLFVQDYLYQYTITHKENLVPIGDLPALLTRLKDEAYTLGIVTSDDYESTMFTLEFLKIKTYFDVVVTGDRFAPKPESEALEYASSTLGILPENILFIGDSSVDAKFASNCGVGVGVTSGVANYEELISITPHVYETIHKVPYHHLFKSLPSK